MKVNASDIPTENFSPVSGCESPRQEKAKISQAIPTVIPQRMYAPLFFFLGVLSSGLQAFWSFWLLSLLSQNANQIPSRDVTLVTAIEINGVANCISLGVIIVGGIALHFIARRHFAQS